MNCGNARVESMIQWKFDLSYESIPKNNKIIVLQHSRDLKSLYFGILKAKKNVKPSKTSTIEDLYDFYATKTSVNANILKDLQCIINEIRTNGKSMANTNEEEESESNNVNQNAFSLLKSYLSPIFEVEQVVSLLKEIKESTSAVPEVPVAAAKGGKPPKVEAPKVIETEHTLLLLDELLESLPIESFLSETLNISSVSRDFSKFLNTFWFIK